MQTMLLNSRPLAKIASLVLALGFVLTPALAFAAPERSTSVVDMKSAKATKGSSFGTSGRSKAKHAPAKKSDKADKSGKPGATHAHATASAKKPCGHASAHPHARTAAAPRKTAHR